MPKLLHIVFAYSFIVLASVLTSCSSPKGKSPLVVKTVLPDELKEISGMTAIGNDIWVITDKPKSRIFKLDSEGRIVQTVHISNIEATDVEAVTSDKNFIYIGDVGDNIGDRVQRRIIKVAINSIPAGREVNATGETIDFVFPNEKVATKKKQNNFDCEAIVSFEDTLYLFTKDREDKETKVYSLPKDSGNYAARYINSFNSKGLITDAAINGQNDELALIGYHKGHQYPFMLIFSNFTGNDFFSGDHQRIELADKPWDWQLEGITYGNGNVYFSCEGTKEVPATFYGIRRDDLFKLKKTKDKKKGTVNEDEEDGK
jgi:hypothetical protein